MQTRPHNRKQQIVELGIDLLQTHGFENFSYQDLSRQLGITKASIHHHFPKKSDLGVALCEAIQQWHEHQYRQVRSMQGGALDKLRHYLARLQQYVADEGKICPLSSLQSDITVLPDEMVTAIKRLDHHETAFIAEILQQGRDNGDFGFQGSVMSQAMIVVLSCKGALQYARIHGDNIFTDTVKQLETMLQR
ncbi:HTH-type transcriptional repressor NemR [Sinobacterium norvegicum]|uniref:HTH-type transcriptional repressor NemR n=1 Tax=Sinobacterium norvegicum TaxID=1641715 RepID=A0ABM9AGX6_9GAMM|nr:TetR/AcrR family transcriptional regulator [Sinobacterium norvegicum]CAH0992405.1 HTH-type transcriptional repressor NemR [Sinobacterium norvegicum]